MNTDFEEIAPGLWQWREWFIQRSRKVYWVLTPVPREFGPFSSFDDALYQVRKLLFLDSPENA